MASIRMWLPLFVLLLVVGGCPTVDLPTDPAPAEDPPAEAPPDPEQPPEPPPPPPPVPPVLPPPPADGSFRPTDIGDELWAWGWAGENGSNVTLVDGRKGKQISFMRDLSGNGNDFYNNGDRKPAYQVGITFDSSIKGGAYSTNLPLIGLNRYVPGSQVYGNTFYQATGMAATGAFYLACAIMNTRNNGNRELYGTDGHNNVMFDQGANDVFITIDGDTEKIVDGALPAGIMVLEIWRDPVTDEITCVANGKDITSGTVTLGGEFDLSGLGHDGSGSSYWDDYSMEFILCDDLPQASERDEIRGYLRTKWGAP